MSRTDHTLPRYARARAKRGLLRGYTHNAHTCSWCIGNMTHKHARHIPLPDADDGVDERTEEEIRIALEAQHMERNTDGKG